MTDSLLVRPTCFTTLLTVGLVLLEKVEVSLNLVCRGIKSFFPAHLDSQYRRFDRRIVVNPPDVKGREAILRVHSRNVTMGKDVDMHTIARGTPGFSGAELASLINKAACHASKVPHTS